MAGAISDTNLFAYIVLLQLSVIQQSGEMAERSKALA